MPQIYFFIPFAAQCFPTSLKLPYFKCNCPGALCGNINRAIGDVYISEHAIACKANGSSDTEWLAQRLDYYNLNRLSESSAQPGLSVNKLLRFKLIVPTLPEQQKIASFLTAIDQRTQLLKKKKEKLEQYKKGMMQKLFSQEIRFKDENGNDLPDWEEKKMGEVYSFISTNSFSREKLNYENGMVKNIHYGDIHTKFKSHFNVDKEEVPFINADISLKRVPEENFLREGDLIIADASEDYNDIGKTIEVISLNGQKMLAGLHTLMARRNNNEMVLGFGGHLMKSQMIRMEIMRIAQGTKVLGISASRLSKLLLPIPSTAEQQKINSFLSAIDTSITKVSGQIEKSKEFKKGLLQKMFV